MGKICKKCEYERLPSDTAPDYQCPKCGAIYAKVDEFLRKKAEVEKSKAEAEARKKAQKEEAQKQVEALKNATGTLVKALSGAEETTASEVGSSQVEVPLSRPRQRLITKTYKGSQAKATALFQKDAEILARQGYVPTSQTWAPGQYGCGAFLLALLLCFLIIGLLVFVYMLIVKPDGTLSVIYEARGQVDNPQHGHENTTDTKVCPRCAEDIKAAAIICRYCGHEFEGA